MLAGMTLEAFWLHGIGARRHDSVSLLLPALHGMPVFPAAQLQQWTDTRRKGSLPS